ncbi:MAG: DUF4349 domain-containing protein [Planctomycetota bacterium]
MNCETAQALIDLEVDGTLTDARTEELRAHLAACPACAADLAELRRVRQLLHAARSEKAPAGALAAIWPSVSIAAGAAASALEKKGPALNLRSPASHAPSTSTPALKRSSAMLSAAAGSSASATATAGASAAAAGRGTGRGTGRASAWRGAEDDDRGANGGKPSIHPRWRRAAMVAVLCVAFLVVSFALGTRGRWGQDLAPSNGDGTRMIAAATRPAAPTIAPAPAGHATWAKGNSGSTNSFALPTSQSGDYGEREILANHQAFKETTDHANVQDSLNGPLLTPPLNKTEDDSAKNGVNETAQLARTLRAQQQAAAGVAAIPDAALPMQHIVDQSKDLTLADKGSAGKNALEAESTTSTGGLEYDYDRSGGQRGGQDLAKQKKKSLPPPKAPNADFWSGEQKRKDGDPQSGYEGPAHEAEADDLQRRDTNGSAPAAAAPATKPGTFVGVTIDHLDAPPPAPLTTTDPSAPPMFQTQPTPPTSKPPQTTQQLPNLTAAPPSLPGTEKLEKPKIIKSGELVVEVKTYSVAAQQAISLAEQYDGYLADDKITDLPGGAKRADIVIRVLPEHFEALFNDLKNLGKVQSERAGAQDVTGAVADTQARIENLQITEARLQELIKSKTYLDRVDDLLAVEHQLEQVRGQIEEMQGQLRAWSDLISYSTIHLTLEEPTLAQPGASLSVEVPGLANAKHTLDAALQSCNGKLLSGQTQKREDGTLMGTYQLQVDLDHFAQMLAAIRGLGRVQDEQIQNQPFSQTPASGTSNVPCNLALVLFEKSSQIPAGTLQLKVASVPDAIKALGPILIGLNVSVVDNQTTHQAVTNSGNVAATSANLQLRVRAGNFGALLDALKPLGKVVVQNVSGEVGTLQGGTADVPATLQLILGEGEKTAAEAPQGTLGVEVDHFAAAQDSLKGIIDQYKIVVKEADSRQVGKQTVAAYTLAVHATQIDAAVAAIEKLGNVTLRQLQGIGLSDVAHVDPDLIGTLVVTIQEKAPVAKPQPQGSLDIEVPDFAKTRAALTQIIEQFNIEVKQANSRVVGKRTEAAYVLSIHADKIDDAVAEIEKLGDVTARQLEAIGLGNLVHPDPDSLGTLTVTITEKAAVEKPLPEGSLGLAVTDYKKAMQDFGQVVKDFKIDVQNADSREEDKLTVATFTLAVPAQQIDDAVAALEKIGDVTNRQYSGVGLGTMAHYDAKDLGHISLTLREKPAAGSRPAPLSGFAQTWRDSLSAFGGSFDTILRGAGQLLPWLLVLLAILWPLSRWWKKSARGKDGGNDGPGGPEGSAGGRGNGGNGGGGRATRLKTEDPAGPGAAGSMGAPAAPAAPGTQGTPGKTGEPDASSQA